MDMWVSETGWSVMKFALMELLVCQKLLNVLSRTSIIFLVWCIRQEAYDTCKRTITDAATADTTGAASLSVAAVAIEKNCHLYKTTSSRYVSFRSYR